MLSMKIRFGVFCNWDHWAFVMRTIEGNNNNDEVLYVSPWIGEDRAKLAYATLMRLSASQLDNIAMKQRGNI